MAFSGYLKVILVCDSSNIDAVPEFKIIKERKSHLARHDTIDKLLRYYGIHDL